ncbi:PEP/pyruvate-binding domain-containing protein [Streptomyces sp. NPDC058371]|uniref:PEP/pyruvate-binding domain-containing protein n=1 Tax=Streptomyces sp. NPDC058371 TaxID=3346463 RepID=UPI003662E0FE
MFRRPVNELPHGPRGGCVERHSAALPVTVALTDDLATDPTVSGRKAATLARLLKAGFPCAGGMVIPVRLHEHFLARDPDVSERDDIPPHLERALDEITDVYRSDQLAVRSSGVAEDTSEASCAGLYASVLDVHGVDALRTAVLQCWRSAATMACSQSGGAADVPAMAVLVQRLLAPDAAGAAFATDPMGGVTDAVSISAVRGRADRLMQGETGADEWTVTSTAATCIRSPYDAITSDQAVAIADLTRRVSTHLSCPAEVEWALLGGEITLLQARPMTAVPDRELVWPRPARGEWRRDIRLGEWLPEPVTPLFATWFLPTIDRRFRRAQWQRSGVLVSKPSYQLIHGWYYHSPLGDRRSSVLLRGMLARPGFACAMLAGRRRPSITNSFVVDKEIAALEKYTSGIDGALLATVDKGLDSLSEGALVAFVSHLVDLVSDYVWPMLLVGGAAWRAEHALARYYRRMLLPDLGLPHHGLLTARQQADDIASHAVSTLDWCRPTLGEVWDGPRPEPQPDPRPDEAGRLEELCLSALARRKVDSARFTRLLTLTRQSARLRRQYTMNLTRPWPAFRQALYRLGAALTDRGVIGQPEDVYFLTHGELLESLSEHRPTRRHSQVSARTQEWKHRCTLRPPLALGTPACLLPLLLTRPAAEAAGRHPDGALVGVGVSPGRATGRVRLVDHLSRAEVTVGEVLVVRSFVPALAPMIRNAGAVAADMGSVAAHMSVIARECGVPAVVALHSITGAVRDGDLITVDGTTGHVFPNGRAL